MRIRMLKLIFHLVSIASPAFSVSIGVDARGSWDAGTAIKKTWQNILAEVGGAKQESSSSVSVHYEALCPDSVEFFKGPKGVKDTFRNSKVDATFTFVPYGNAQKGGAKWGHRNCQHGDRECYGNAWATCAQAVLTNKTQVTSHLICLMDLPKAGMPKTYWYPSPWGCGDYNTCVVSKCSSSLTSVQKSSIETCVSEIKTNGQTCAGCKLMNQHASDAHSNKVNHVPWVIVDGEHQEGLDEGSLKLEDYLTINSASNVYAQGSSQGVQAVNLSAVDPADWVVPPARNPLMQRE